MTRRVHSVFISVAVGMMIAATILGILSEPDNTPKTNTTPYVSPRLHVGRLVIPPNSSSDILGDAGSLESGPSSKGAQERPKKRIEDSKRDSKYERPLWKLHVFEDGTWGYWRTIPRITCKEEFEEAVDAALLDSNRDTRCCAIMSIGETLNPTKAVDASLKADQRATRTLFHVLVADESSENRAIALWYLMRIPDQATWQEVLVVAQQDPAVDFQTELFSSLMKYANGSMHKRHKVIFPERTPSESRIQVLDSRRTEAQRIITHAKASHQSPRVRGFIERELRNHKR